MSEPIIASELRRLAGMDELIELALDLRWSWDHGADEIWRPLAPELWDLTRNPWIILQTVAPGKLKELAADVKFRARVETLLQEMRTSSGAAAWFQKTQAKAPLTTVAYFSMEFMLGEALPILLGRLGQRRRRSAQSRQRSRGAGRRRRVVVSAGVFSTGHRRRWVSVAPVSY